MATATSVKLNRFKLNKAEAEEVDGAHWSVFVSPYDVPEEVVGDYVPGSRKCSVRFRYMAGDEPLAERKVEGAVVLGLGRRSSRLYQIDCELDPKTEIPTTAASLVKRVTEALLKLAESEKESPRRGNYKIVKMIVENYGDELFAAILRHSVSANAK